LCHDQPSDEAHEVPRRAWQLSGPLIPPTYRSASGLIATPIKVVRTNGQWVMRLLMNLCARAGEQSPFAPRVYSLEENFTPQAARVSLKPETDLAGP